MGDLDVYVLGAGASYVHGAPLTDEILWYAITQTGAGKDPRIRQLVTFLKDVFGFQPIVRRKTRPACDYPGLVDVLSVVDMAVDRRESLSQKYDGRRLREIRRALEFAIFKALDHSLSRQSKTGRSSRATSVFVQKIRKHHSAIISLNYDLVIDVALNRRLGPHQYGTTSLPEEAGRLRFVDYGLHFRGTHPVREGSAKFKLLKLHGSLNWLHDPASGDVYFGGLKKIVGGVFDRRGKASHDLRKFFKARPPGLEPIMVTPTHLKDLRNVHVVNLWRQAEQVLRDATSITFIGYSLPGDDLHIKYLFKRALQSRTGRPPRMTVVNHARPANGKKGEKPEVIRTYERFLGSRVEAHLDGFEPWVQNVMNSA